MNSSISRFLRRGHPRNLSCCKWKLWFFFLCSKLERKKKAQLQFDSVFCIISFCFSSPSEPFLKRLKPIKWQKVTPKLFHLHLQRTLCKRKNCEVLKCRLMCFETHQCGWTRFKFRSEIPRSSFRHAFKIIAKVLKS